MFQILAIKSALVLATKNAGITIAMSIPFAVIIATFPDFRIDLVIYGVFGGLTRWLATKCSMWDGIAGVAIGMLMALGFEGTSIPFLKDFVVGESQIAHVSSYILGLLGNLVFDYVIRIAKTKLDP